MIRSRNTLTHFIYIAENEKNLKIYPPKFALLEVGDAFCLCSLLSILGNERLAK